MSSIKEQIRAEIERLKKHYRIREEYGYGWKNALNAISKFLDTLPEQPVEGLEEAAEEYAKKYAKEQKPKDADGEIWRVGDVMVENQMSYEDGFIAGAEWVISQGKEVKDAALKLCETVERYTNGAALRSELLNTVTQTRLKMR